MQAAPRRNEATWHRGRAGGRCGGNGPSGRDLERMLQKAGPDRKNTRRDYANTARPSAQLVQAPAKRRTIGRGAHNECYTNCAQRAAQLVQPLAPSTRSHNLCDPVDAARRVLGQAKRPQPAWPNRGHPRIAQRVQPRGDSKTLYSIKRRGVHGPTTLRRARDMRPHSRSQPSRRRSTTPDNTEAIAARATTKDLSKMRG